MGERRPGGQSTKRPLSFSSRVSRGAAWALAGQGSVAAMALLNFAALGRYVSPHEYGDYVLALLALAAVQWLALSAYREPAVQTPTLSPAVADSLFWFSSVIGLVLALAMLLLAWVLFGHPMSEEIAVCIAILAVKLFADTAASIPTALRVRALDFGFIARRSVVASTVGTAVNISLLIADYGIYSMAVSQALSSLILLATILAGMPRLPAWHFRLKDLAVLKGYSPHVILWQAIDMINQSFDRFFVAARLSVGVLGIYGFGRRLNDVVIEVLAGATASVSLPAFASIQNDLPRLRAGYIRSLRAVTFFVLPTIALLFVTAEDFVPLVFSAKWSDAVPIYRCFLLAGVIQTIGILQATLIRSLGKTALWSRYTLVQTAANLLVITALIDYGPVVLAAGIVLRTYLIWGWSVAMTCRLAEIRIWSYVKELSKPVGASLAAAAVAAVAATFLEDMSAIVRLLGVTAAGVLAYAALALLFMRETVRDLISLASKR